jgi:ADP-ribose pyrophosphatase
VVVLLLAGPQGRVVLIEHYRHATRRWHWEAVRGFGDPGATAEENVARELREEIAVTVSGVVALGDVHPDTGLLAHRVELYAARVDGVGELETGEGLRRAVMVTAAEAEAMVADGRITDGFTLAGLFDAAPGPGAATEGPGASYELDDTECSRRSHPTRTREPDSGSWRTGL